MDQEKGKVISRMALALLVILSGLALLPFSGLSAEKLGWEQYAGIYQPILTVEVDRGFPGSAFVFHGSGYPPNALATVYIDGNARGTLFTNGDGTATFLIQSQPTDMRRRYYITLATDANTSATQDIRLRDDEPILPPPPGFVGPIFELTGPTLTPTPTATPNPGAPVKVHLPLIQKP